MSEKNLEDLEGLLGLIKISGDRLEAELNGRGDKRKEITLNWIYLATTADWHHTKKSP